METTTRKMLKALTSIFAGWFVGAMIYFVFSIIGDFSNRSRYIPAVFTGGMVLLIVLYFIYWVKAKRDTDFKVGKVVCCAIGCIVCMLCLVLAVLLFSSSVFELFIAAVIEGILLLAGQICAYILGGIKI